MFCLRDVLKTSSRYVFKTSWRRLQHNNFSSSKTSWRLLEDVLREVLKTSSRRLCKTSSRCLRKTSSRCLQDVLENVKLLRWGRVEDVFKTYLEDIFKTSWRPTNVCWDISEKMSGRSTNFCYKQPLKLFVDATFCVSIFFYFRFISL